MNGKPLLSDELLASQKGPHHMENVSSLVSQSVSQSIEQLCSHSL
jgi:hypothetical protein